MKILLRNGGRTAASTATAWVAAGLGLPALVAVMFLAVLVLGIACWIISDGERSDRVTRMIFARRGDIRCLDKDQHGSDQP
jgi:hypothetical protein